MRIFDNFPSDRRERDAPIPRNKIRLVTSLYYIARDNIFERRGEKWKIAIWGGKEKKNGGWKISKNLFSIFVDERRRAKEFSLTVYRLPRPRSRRTGLIVKHTSVDFRLSTSRV